MTDTPKFDEAAAVGTLADLLAIVPAELDRVDKLALLVGLAMRASGLGPGEVAQACCRLTENLGGRPGKHIVYLPDGGWLDIAAYSIARIEPPGEGEGADDPQPLTIN